MYARRTHKHTPTSVVQEQIHDDSLLMDDTEN